jgi:hypothetical protein
LNVGKRKQEAARGSRRQQDEAGENCVMRRFRIVDFEAFFINMIRSSVGMDRNEKFVTNCCT